uniref:ATP synthase F0 subunit 6 n=1 Tax=Metagonimus yokogawai TaxID=84529 RepID=V9NDT2_9TREM|nr:ATP synthase F0 subunit 6 [Metagonimus yokogawai]AGN12760.1 ATP synthase F0 subunit 6 [Metagonimus yokogawai]
MFISRLLSVYAYVCSWINGGWGDWFYRLPLFFLLVAFVGLRLPYLYGMGSFGVFILIAILPVFLSLFWSRAVDGKRSEFFCGFVPEGTPVWIAPFVCLAETLSYLVRPVVLMIRPFVNLTIGAMGGYALGLMCFLSWWVVFFLFLLFFYEIFVALVHWYIVCSILSFSEGH